MRTEEKQSKIRFILTQYSHLQDKKDVITESYESVPHAEMRPVQSWRTHSSFYSLTAISLQICKSRQLNEHLKKKDTNTWVRQIGEYMTRRLHREWMYLDWFLWSLYRAIPGPMCTMQDCGAAIRAKQKRLSNNIHGFFFYTMRSKIVVSADKMRFSAGVFFSSLFSVKLTCTHRALRWLYSGRSRCKTGLAAYSSLLQGLFARLAALISAS